ncbi:MAG: LPS-assembly protein LptD, partial [Deinococcus-Thermus bacterium]|nr:LPS-assembly protein LptD [Deinococcota bacterium]
MSGCALLRALCAAAFLAAGPPERGAAQTAEARAATLIADRVEIDADGRLVASGAVEAVQGETRLAASRIVYDDAEGSLRIDGPITLSQGEDTVVLADAGALSSDLRDGLLRSARLVLDRKLQLAAAEINRVDGRYTQLSKVVASACEVCAARPVPLWQIRSSRVIHDQDTRQIYFFDPRFELYGVPVLYLPRLRLPDPTVERATGFLVPEFAQTDELGFGVKQPYFVALSPSRDLKLTPYLSPETTTLEARYRQAFRRGRLRFDGAISRDSLRPDEIRGYLFGSGGFALPRGYALAFDAEFASDADYLDDYGVSGKDRLDSAVSLSRIRRDRLFFSEGIFFDVPGAENVDATRPDLLGDAVWIRRFTPGLLGGRATLRFAAHGHRRPSEADVAGRDVGRLEAEIGWRRDAVGPGGVLLAAEARLPARHDAVGNDP